MIEAVAVIGPGRMGRQIALTCALGGCRALLIDLKPRSDARAALADARREIARDLRLMAEEGVISAGEIPPTLARLEDRRGLDGLESCGFVQEALPESVELKREVFARLAGRVADDAIVASTSSTISPRHLADAVPGPERFLVVHWLNPAHVIPLVEVVPGAATSAAVVDRTITFLTHLGKTPVRCGDAPGFIVPRLQVVLMNEAVRLVEEGVATPEDVDIIVRTTFGYRLPFFGPFAIADMAGLDVYSDGFRTLQQHYGERLAAPKLLTDLVSAGRYGVKQGGGFVTPAGEQAPLVAYRNTAYARLGQLLKELGPVPKGGSDE